MVSHKIGKIPDELSNHIFFAFLIQNQMILLEQTFLVLLAEHQRWILEFKAKRELRNQNWQNCKCQIKIKIHVIRTKISVLRVGRWQCRQPGYDKPRVKKD